MEITGECFCGEVQYRATIDEARIAICHCRDCQRLSGSAFRTACAVKPANFSFTRGSPSYFDKESDTGNIRRLAFCGTCGTHICSLPGEDPDKGFVSLRVATSDAFERMRPAIEVYCDSRVDWMPPLDATVQFPRMPG